MRLPGSPIDHRSRQEQEPAEERPIRKQRRRRRRRRRQKRRNGWRGLERLDHVRVDGDNDVGVDGDVDIDNDIVGDDAKKWSCPHVSEIVACLQQRKPYQVGTLN